MGERGVLIRYPYDRKRLSNMSYTYGRSYKSYNNSGKYTPTTDFQKTGEEKDNDYMFTGIGQYGLSGRESSLSPRRSIERDSGMGSVSARSETAGLDEFIERESVKVEKHVEQIEKGTPMGMIEKDNLGMDYMEKYFSEKLEREYKVQEVALVKCRLQQVEQKLAETQAKLLRSENVLKTQEQPTTHNSGVGLIMIFTFGMLFGSDFMKLISFQ